MRLASGLFIVEIMTIDGQIIWLKQNVKSGDVVFPQNIPQGIFFLFIKKSNEIISILKLIKNKSSLNFAKFGVYVKKIGFF